VEFLPEYMKTLVDIGLGAVSLMLWFRQGKVNRAQQALDEKQNKTAEDLTLMVKDHDARIVTLERSTKIRKRAR
jgi:hypothetical protein